MAQTLEAIRGGGGSVKIGATGTVGSLMIRELDYAKSTPETPVSSKNKSPTTPISVPCGSVAAKRLQARKSLDGVSTSGCSQKIGYRTPEISLKTKNYTHKNHRIPMLNSDNIVLDRTPSREKTEKKGSNIVEIVDVKCGYKGDKLWATPITSRLKKLGFSKLSETIN